MLVGSLRQNDYLVTIPLGGTISLFSTSDPDKAPLPLSGHMRNINSLVALRNNPKVILSSSYDGVIVKWIQKGGYGGRLERKVNAQIKCFAATEEEIVTSGFDNMILRNSLLEDQCGDADSIDIGNQPKDLSLAILSPELTLVSIKSGVVFINGTKVVSTTNLGLAVAVCEIAPEGSEAIVGGQDGKLRVFSTNGDTLTEETGYKK
ncbi:Actin-interacting protein 1-2 [Sarracenia purpurea var. burkii]